MNKILGYILLGIFIYYIITMLYSQPQLDIVGDHLSENIILYNGQGIQRNGYTLVQKHNGDLVLSDKNDKIVWISNTSNKGKAPYYTMYIPNGNVNVMDSNNTVLWSSQTTGLPSNSLQIYNGRIQLFNEKGVVYTINSNGKNIPPVPFKIIGQSLNKNINTIHNGQAIEDNGFVLAQGSNGNLVLYNKTEPEKTLWSSNTSSNLHGHFYTVYLDNDIKIYNKNNLLWSSKTTGIPSDSLRITHGQLALYNDTRKVWSINPLV